MGKPSVSIIIPVYQVEKYIRRCLRSVMHQQGVDFPVECILVDDASPDGSMAVAEQLTADYQGSIEFRTARHEHNRGLSAARNTGISLATGDYLLFVDSDDFITDDCLQVLFSAVRQHAGIQVVKGNHKGRVSVDVARIPQQPLDNDTLLPLLYMGVIPVMAWNTLVSRSLVEQHHLRFREGMVYEDNLWSVELFRLTTSFLFVPQVTYHYEANPESILGNTDVIACPPKYLPYKIAIVRELLDSFDTRHHVPYTCYLVSHLMQMFDSLRKTHPRPLPRGGAAPFPLTPLPSRGGAGVGSVEVDSSDVKKLRNRLVRLTLKQGRLVLALYELLLFKPLRCLMRYRWFRHNYHRIEKITYKLAQ